MHKTLKKQTLVLSAAALMVTMTIRAADDQTTAGSAVTKAESKTISFIKDAARDNNMEIALAEVGAQKAQNAELKSFCQQLQQDHTQANQQLQPLAQKYGVNLDELKDKSHHEVTKFEKDTAGAKFDQDFATEMLKSHQKNIKRFEDASTKLKEADVQQYAQTILPKLREHFAKAASVAAAVGVDQSTITSYAKKLPESVGGTSDSDVDTSKGASSSSKDLQNSNPQLNK